VNVFSSVVLFLIFDVDIENCRFEWNCVFGSKNRKTLICAANQEAEEAFKKTVAIDYLIDMLREANPREVWFSNLSFFTGKLHLTSMI